MYNGVIIVNKEAGFTSHDVVAKLRGILKQKKIGHTGTLDPDAIGVLPVCLGHATKLCDMLTDKDKTYEAVMLLGRVTDTQDTSGKTIAESDVKTLMESGKLTNEKIIEAIQSFIGEYHQIPPMYSALKVNGKKLYELAREGIEVERKARQVFINSIEDISIDFQRVTMTVSCSKGTYIRTLCHDIGEKLGCGACMDKLKRTRVSTFTIENALKLNEINDIVAMDCGIEKHIVTVEKIFESYRVANTKPEFDRLIYNGNSLNVNMVELQDNIAVEDKESVRMYDSNKKFMGIFIYSKKDKMFKVEKMFLN